MTVLYHTFLFLFSMLYHTYMAVLHHTFLSLHYLHSMLHSSVISHLQAIATSGGKNVPTSLIGSPWFAWLGDGEHMANQIDQNPNQFLTQPNQLSPDPNPLSHIATRHANKFISSSKPAFNSVHTVFKPMPNQTRNSEPRSASAYIQQLRI